MHSVLFFGWLAGLYFIVLVAVFLLLEAIHGGRVGAGVLTLN